MARRPLPRHVIGAIWTLTGFVGGITLLLVLPRYFGVAPKLAGFISMIVWLGSTWVFWMGGEAPPPKPAAEPAAGSEANPPPRTEG